VERIHILPLYFLFSIGSFISSFIIETLEKKKQNLFVIPTVIEALILIGIALK
jgi:hypothetical protein